MKIAILTPEFTTELNWHGGLANYLSHIARGLRTRAHTVHVFVYSDRQETVQYHGIVLHRLHVNEKYVAFFNRLTLHLFPVFALTAYGAYVTRREFLRVHQREHFDIVHAASYLTPALFLHAKKIGIPIITRISSLTKYYQRASLRRNKFDTFLIACAEKRVIRVSSKVCVPSRLFQQIIQKEYKKKIDLVESPAHVQGLDDENDFFYHTYLRSKKYLLFYGTLSRLKGSEFIAKNIHYFFREHQDYYFVFIGKMEVHRSRRTVLPIEDLLQQAKEYAARVIYVNSLPHRLLFPVIRRASAIVLPSVIDNLPNTCIEAMSLGKIVIGTYEGGFDQLITPGENGFLVHSGDHQALRDAFDFIGRADQEQLAAIGKKAQDTVRQRLNFEDKMHELEQYYATAITDFKKIGPRGNNACR